MENTENQNLKIDISTHEPTFFQKVMQCYHTMPKSWLLKKFQVDGENIYIETLNGKNFSAQIMIKALLNLYGEMKNDKK